MRSLFPLVPLVAAVAALALPHPTRAEEKTDAAVAAAKAWLALVDAKDYKKSWSEAAPFFKERVTEGDWAKAAALARDPFGALKLRELLSAQLATSLPGAPDGDYVVIRFKASFERKAEAVETITPMKDDKGVWRVSGYFVR